MSNMVEFYFINTNDVRAWIAGSSYEVEDPKKPILFYENKKYINGSMALLTVPDSFYMANFDGRTIVSDAFSAATGYVIEQFSVEKCIEIAKTELDQLHHSSIEKLLPFITQAVNSANNRPCITIKNSHSEHSVDHEQSIIKNGIQDGDILTFHVTTNHDVVLEGIHSFIQWRERNIERERLCVRFITPTLDGTSFLQHVMRKLPDNQSNEIHRPMIILLYTDEDIAVATYVRTYFDALDRASGESCDVYCIEDPNAVDSSRHWRAMLEKKAYQAWKLLGWATAVPYDRNQVYQIARQLHIPFSMLPCAVELCDGNKNRVWRLNGDLTQCFRNIFASYQMQNSQFQNKQHYLSYNQSNPSGRMLRKFVYTMLRTDSELEAFCLDFFPEIYRRFSVMMEGTHKVSLLLCYADHEELLVALSKSDPERYLEQKHILAEWE